MIFWIAVACQKKWSSSASQGNILAMDRWKCLVSVVRSDLEREANMSLKTTDCSRTEGKGTENYAVEGREPAGGRETDTQTHRA